MKKNSGKGRLANDAVSTPAWKDDDDEDDSYNDVSKMGSSSGALQWVKETTQLRKRQREDREVGLTVEDAQNNCLDLATTSALLGDTRSVLTSRILRYQRLPDVKALSHVKHSSLTSHEYSPNGQILVAVGPIPATLRIFRVSGIETKKIGSIPLPDNSKMTCARFVSGGHRMLCTGPQPSILEIDLETQGIRPLKLTSFYCRDYSLCDTETTGSGYRVIVSNKNESTAHVLDTRTYRLASTLHYSCPTSQVQFAKGNDHHVWVCSGSNVALWDLRYTPVAISSHDDHGGVRITAFHASDALHAVGSEVGVVSVYRNDFASGAFVEVGSNKVQVEPLGKSMNLTTEISSLAINHDSQLMMSCSAEKASALRMTHLPTFTTYENFPRVMKNSIGRVCDVTFRPDSSVASVCSGNQSRILQYSLAAYLNN